VTEAPDRTEPPGRAARSKLSVPAGDGWAPHSHSHAWRLEQEESGPPRLVAAPDRDQVGLLIELSRTLPEPFLLVWALLSMRQLFPPGRYQTSQPVSREELEAFLGRFREFFEQDGRHHLLVASAVEPSTLFLDHHQVLYLYGRLDDYQLVLRRAGMGEGPVIVPEAHRHEVHAELDRLEQEVAAAFRWTWNSLEPDDEPVD
jgi:hypothetical protein